MFTIPCGWIALRRRSASEVFHMDSADDLTFLLCVCVDLLALYEERCHHTLTTSTEDIALSSPRADDVTDPRDSRAAISIGQRRVMRRTVQRSMTNLLSEKRLIHPPTLPPSHSPPPRNIRFVILYLLLISSVPFSILLATSSHRFFFLVYHDQWVH